MVRYPVTRARNVRPVTIDGVEFKLFNVGAGRRQWRSLDGKCIVNFSRQLQIYNATCRGKRVNGRFGNVEAAMRAAIEASR